MDAAEVARQCRHVAALATTFTNEKEFWEDAATFVAEQQAEVERLRRDLEAALDTMAGKPMPQNMAELLKWANVTALADLVAERDRLRAALRGILERAGPHLTPTVGEGEGSSHLPWGCIEAAHAALEPSAGPTPSVTNGRVYRELESLVRDIASRIGPARMPESIRAELEELANRLAVWGREPSASPPPCAESGTATGESG